jgi:hypothetical protein
MTGPTGFYVPYDWKPGSAGKTAVTELQLDHIEGGIDAADAANAAVVAVMATDAEVATLFSAHNAAADPHSVATYLRKAIFTAKGDQVGVTASGTVIRVGVGTDNLVMTADSTAAHGWSWKVATDTGAVQKTFYDAKGDSIFASANDTPGKLTVGADNLVPIADAAQALGVKWGRAAGLPWGLNTQAGTAYTLALTDIGNIVEMNNTSAMTLTVPPLATVSFPQGVEIPVRRYGSGTMTVAQGAGVTVRPERGTFTLRAQYSMARLFYRGSNEWILSGDTT